MAILVPHFDLPFRVGSDGHPLVVEQDTIEDISNCVFAVVATQPGDRDEVPEFGTPDLVLQKQPLNLELIAGALEEWEPRAAATLDQEPDVFEQLAATVRVKIQANTR